MWWWIDAYQEYFLLFAKFFRYRGEWDIGTRHKSLFGCTGCTFGDCRHLWRCVLDHRLYMLNSSWRLKLYGFGFKLPKLLIDKILIAESYWFSTNLYREISIPRGTGAPVDLLQRLVCRWLCWIVDTFRGWFFSLSTK